MRVVVTGGSGRLGQFVVRELFSHGHQVSVLDLIKPRECLCPTYTADLTKAQALQDYFKGVDGVVHLARQRFPYTVTNNVLAAAQAGGAKKIVCGSSLAVYGFYYPSSPLVADYLPIDEEHPRRPQDPYGLSKLVGEELCDALSVKAGIQIASLRFSGIYSEEHRGLLGERSKNPLVRGTGALWSYIDARDAARACRLALEANFPGYQPFNICAPDTIVDAPTSELVSKYLPQVKSVRKGAGRWSGYDSAKAERMLAFRAQLLLHV
jgi:nucleoside-diphosphate-sugar epimerase